MKTYKILKRITAILFAVATAFTVLFTIDIINDGAPHIFTAFGVFFWCALSIGALAVPFFVALIGLIITAIKRSQGLCSVGTLVYFIVFTLLPHVVYFVCVKFINIFLAG